MNDVVEHLQDELQKATFGVRRMSDTITKTECELVEHKERYANMVRWVSECESALAILSNHITKQEIAA